MTRTFLSLILAAAASAGATYEIDSAHSAAQFTVKHMMVTNVRGTMGKMSGTIQYDPANLAASSVKATVDVLGINTNEPKRDAHLKSPDFFDAERWSKIEFVSTKWWKEGDKVKIAGNLTMHGVTKPVTLDAEISPQVGNKIGAVATTKINRKDWGLTWNRAIEAGGVAVGEEVSITLDIEANAAK
jgi:polyisoprenoid-binding protein YceI